MKKLLLAASSAAVLMSAAPAIAGGPAPDWQQVQRDPDGRHMGGQRPGMGGRGVMRMDPAKMFDHIDANHDGSISRQEFMSAHQRMMQHRQGGPRGQDGRRGPRPDAPRR